jgi:hypothetical protein
MSRPFKIFCKTYPYSVFYFSYFLWLYFVIFFLLFQLSVFPLYFVPSFRWFLFNLFLGGNSLLLGLFYFGTLFVYSVPNGSASLAFKYLRCGVIPSSKTFGFLNYFYLSPCFYFTFNLDWSFFSFFVFADFTTFVLLY